MNATDAPASEGLRERKQRETRQRIAELALRLFLDHGYDGTTLDAIASAAGISRRTFFSYFKSKDDIILFGMEADSAELIAELLKTSPDVPPLDAVRDVMVKRIARYTTEEMTAIDNLMLSSESLLARKQAFYAKQEQALFLALREVWRQPERQTALRMVAMASVGAMRLALQAWREQTGKRKPAAQFLRDAFDSLRTGL
ncbi:MAG TPA: helix-turn-helix domain-containing protein [Burkholderiaceae bacterium]|nr:helix-turn-helix domain-containing protein [Burkholderiaceae bacterium]